MPTTWLQNVNPAFIVIFAPIFGWMWTALAKRHRNPSIPVKFSLGLLGLAAGFFVLSWGAANAIDASKASVAGLVAGQLEVPAPSALFWNVALFVGGAGVLALLLSPFVRRLMAGIE